MVVVSAGLALSRHEVSLADYKRYWAAAGKARFGNALPSCRNRETVTLFSRRNFEAPDIRQDDSHPVVCVSYAMAEHYAEHLATRSGQPYRLPKAAELAALLGSAGDCSDNLRDQSYLREFRGRGEYPCDDGHAVTAPVGSFSARGPGLFDLDGNVSEWTSDCVDARCSERILMGRSWELESGREVRRGFPADTASNTIGLRLARDLPARKPAAP
jgi:formylglycine-generating enzyme required for sulfatase activity